MRLPFFSLTAALALVPRARSVTVYTTFVTDSNGQMLQPSNTNTATGPAYSGYTGASDKAFPFLHPFFNLMCGWLDLNSLQSN